MIYHKKQPVKKPIEPPAPPPPKKVQKDNEPCSCTTGYAKWCEDMVGRLYYASIAMNNKKIKEILQEISDAYRKDDNPG